MLSSVYSLNESTSVVSLLAANKRGKENWTLDNNNDLLLHVFDSTTIEGAYGQHTENQKLYAEVLSFSRKDDPRRSGECISGTGPDSRLR